MSKFRSEPDKLFFEIDSDRKRKKLKLNLNAYIFQTQTKLNCFSFFNDFQAITTSTIPLLSCNLELNLKINEITDCKWFVIQRISYTKHAKPSQGEAFVITSLWGQT